MFKSTFSKRCILSLLLIDLFLAALCILLLLWPGNTLMTLLFRCYLFDQEQSMFSHSRATSNGFSSLPSDLQGFLAGHARQQPWALGQHRKLRRTHRSERIGRFVFWVEPCACVHSCFNMCSLNQWNFLKPIFLSFSVNPKFILNDYSY